MRRLAALLAVAALAFSQLAAAAIACPGESASASRAMSYGADCDGPMGAPSPLCLHHCTDAPQSLDKPHAPSVPSAAVVGFVAWPALRPASLPLAVPSVPARATPPPELPLTLRHCVLRI